MPDWLSPLADILSTVGFAMTVWVLIVTRSLRRAFALRARTPELRKSLSSVVKSLPPLLGNWPNSRNETLPALIHCRAILENLALKLPRSERTSTERLIARLNGQRTGLFKFVSVGEYSDQELWSIFAELQGVIASLEQREKDATWE